MYKNNLAAAIKANGNILREFGDTVYIPFGSEYQIRLRNLIGSRVKINVEIDGQNVTDGGLVLNAFQTIALERFIRNGNLSTGNRFKFIERTSKIENHRGIKLEDGLIIIRYEFEIPPVTFKSPSQPVWGAHSTGCGRYRNSVSQRSVSYNETGITVEGSKSNQQFGTTNWSGSSGREYTIIFKLLGETEENKRVREPVTVKTKLECKTCGTKNPATSKFCSECGTALEIL
jgi:hypothetical protein